MAEAVKEYSGLDFMAMDEKQALEAVKARAWRSEQGELGRPARAVLRRVCRGVTLIQPTFIADYPVEVSRCHKRKGIRPA